ncbi:MAG TPA: extracellular solute-binding protein [Candidatus Binatia bacterium]|jgi:iron(III) transport system substrate-binding protein
MKSRRFFQVTITCLLLLPALVFAQGLDRIVEGAKKEGKAKIGLTVRWQEGGKPGAKKIVELFQSRYPFVKIEYERVGGSRERERVLSELAAGQVSYDVTVLSETQVPIALKANVIEKIDWRALGVVPQHVHDNDVGINYRSQLYGIAYNRKLVPDSVGAKLNWDDCASAQYRGKIAIDSRPRHLEIFWQPQVWGRERTLAHARRLADNATKFEQDRTAAITKLALGEYAIVCGSFYSTYYEAVRSGENSQLAFRVAEPVPMSLGDVVFVPRGVPHPNAARLWVAWSISEEGQKVLDEVEGSGSPLFPTTQAARMIKGKKVAWYEPQWRAKADEILKEVLEAVGLPVVR